MLYCPLFVSTNILSLPMRVWRYYRLLNLFALSLKFLYYYNFQTKRKQQPAIQWFCYQRDIKWKFDGKMCTQRCILYITLFMIKLAKI